MGADLSSGCTGTPELEGVDMFDGGTPRTSSFKVVAHSDKCGGGDCPTIYTREGDDAYYVQGMNVSPEALAGLSIPNGENVVRIPKELLANLLKP